MRLTLIAAALLITPLAACNLGSESAAAPEGEAAASPPVATAARAPLGASARANLTTPDGTSVGSATFRQGPTGVLIRVEATGLPTGWHGLHLHAVGQCEGPKFDSAGSHVQHGAGGVPHGYLNAEGPDAGDLPNLFVSAGGRGMAEVFTTGVSLVEGQAGQYLLDTDGSAILIHANADDYSTQPIGGAGDRIACGVLGRAEPSRG